MAIFFFHLIDDVVTPDVEGMDLPDVAAAHAKAIKAAREIAAAQILAGKLCLHHRIEVQDAEGRPVLTLPFRAAFEIEEEAGSRT